MWRLKFALALMSLFKKQLFPPPVNHVIHSKKVVSVSHQIQLIFVPKNKALWKKN